MKVSVTGDVPETAELTPLEREVLKAALTSAGTGHVSLSEQLNLVEVASRTYSGVGFVTRLRLPPDAPLLQGALASLPAVYGAHPDLLSPAEFLLQIKDGGLHCIEAFCFEGLWPRDEQGFRLRIAE